MTTTRRLLVSCHPSDVVGCAPPPAGRAKRSAPPTTTGIANQATRRHLLVAALAALAIPAYAIDYREISWDDLVPKDWDPMKSFRDLQNLEALPDTDPRIQKLYDRMRQVWDSAPTVPAMQGKEGRIAGYLVPLEEGKQGIREFLLVP